MTNNYGIQNIPDVYQCTDYRDKYWGWIKTCTATEDFTLKHIFMNKGGQSSLEYHVKKDENYYILYELFQLIYSLNTKFFVETKIIIY